MSIRRLCLVPLAALALLLSGCAVSEEQEVQMGLDAAPKFEKQFGGLHPDKRVQRYVSDIGHRLSRHAGRDDLPWSFEVLDNKEMNAFALPGGPVYITYGMLSRLQNEAQLAGIIAHEVAHVAKRHSAEQIEKAQVAQGGAALAGVISGSDSVTNITGLVTQLGMMKFGRDDEEEADLVGLDYMVKEGYDPRGMVQAMQIIKKSSGSRGGMPEFLSTHPDPGNRVEYLQDRIDKKYRNTRGTLGDRKFRQIVAGSSRR